MGLRKALTGALALAAFARFAPSAQARFDKPPTCSFEVGVVTIDSRNRQVTIGRRGERVVVSYARGRAKCKPASPTLSNADAIRMSAESTIDLGGGPGFAARTKAGIGSLLGGGGADTLIGTDSYDAIEGGRGAGAIDGGGKPDFIETRDGSRDVVHCGGGRDTLLRDRRDRARGCEHSYLPGQRPSWPEPPDLTDLHP